MPIIAKKSEGRELQATGTYHAVCTTIVDLGTQQPKNPKYRPRQEVFIAWELCGETVEYERDGEKRSFVKSMSRRYPLFLGSNKASDLRKMLESWRGQPFTAEELDGFELRNVLDANCLLTVVHNESNGTIYANVGSVSPLVKGTSKRKAETERLYFTLSDIPAGAPLTWPKNMPDWMRETIMKSAEYVTRFEGGAHEDQGGYDGPPPIEDDDIPF